MMQSHQLKNSCLVFLVALLCLSVRQVTSTARPPTESDNSQCIGTQIDYSRVLTVSGLDWTESGGTLLDLGNYIATQYIKIPSKLDSELSQCELGRVRLQEMMGSHPIYGSTLVATTTNGIGCGRSGESKAASNFNGTYAKVNATVGEPTETMTLLNDLQITDLFGNKFSNVQVEMARSPGITPGQALAAVAAHFGVTRANVNSSQPTLQVFVSTAGDLLTYFVDDVLITFTNGTAGLYLAIVDANAPKVLSLCTYVDPQAGLPRRRKGPSQPDPPKKNRQLQNTCSSCSTIFTLQSFGSETSCPVNTLYLDDTGRTTTCTAAFVTGLGFINVPGPVNSLFWEGTYDCKGTAGPCALPQLPSCADAISDIQYAAVRTLQYLQTELNVLGGLNSDASNPQPIRAFAHWKPKYCNAFFSGPGSIYFGDCDCNLLTELVSVDIVSHEIMHGVTRYSSALQYSEQSGGLNEGYSDILGCVMEFLVNDSIDTADFTVAESLKGTYGVFRYMENPALDGKSIDNINNFVPGMNVHYSSGILNKAFVTAVRACEANGCAGRAANCVKLLGELFLYTNIQTLVPLSTFNDAALLTCRMVPEYLRAIAFTDFCSEGTLAQFVIQGWSAVGIALEQSSCALSTPAPTPVPSPSPVASPTLTPSPTQAPTPSASICFSELATIPVLNQGPVAMSHLRVGDYVQTLKGYQPIYAFGHHSQNAHANFLRIYTWGRSAPLEISGEHLVYLWKVSNPVRADSVKMGEYLQREQGGALVTRVEAVRRRGVYAPLTADGTLVVDGIVSSCYISLQMEAKDYVQFRTGTSTMLSQHFAVHLALAPLRIACLGVSNQFCYWNDGETGLNQVVKAGLMLAEIAKQQVLLVQGLLLLAYLLLFGSFYILECTLGPQFSAIFLFMAVTLTLQRRISRHLFAKQKGKQD